MCDAEKSTMLQPGQQIRPQTNTTIAINLIKQLYGLTVTRIKELMSYDDRNYFVEVQPEHSNRNIKQLWQHGYVLKILNSMDSKKHHVGKASKQLQKLLFHLVHWLI